MLGVTHAASGAAAGAWMAAVATPSAPATLLGVGVGALAAYAPDIDHRSATATRALGPIGKLLSWVLRNLSKVLTGREHRGFCHSLLFALLLGVGTLLLAGIWLPLALAAYLAAAVVAGVVAALLGDLVTNSGLQHLMWPLKIKVSIPHRLRICTGGVTERYAVFPVMVVEIGVGLAQATLGGYWWILGLTIGGVVWAVVAIVLSSTWSWRSSSSSASRGRSHPRSTRSTARSRSGH